LNPNETLQHIRHFFGPTAFLGAIQTLTKDLDKFIALKAAIPRFP
jgi:hypothetical protein